jgi:hypothetical protein
MINDQIYKIDTLGYRCFIVDMTFSRLTINNRTFYKDLSSILRGECKKQDGKKLKMQDMVYQLMQDEIGDDWEKFRPRTNIHWLVYVLKTMKGCELFKKNNSEMSRLLVDYYNYAGECDSLIKLIDYIVEKSLSPS